MVRKVQRVNDSGERLERLANSVSVAAFLRDVVFFLAALLICLALGVNMENSEAPFFGELSWEPI